MVFLLLIDSLVTFGFLSSHDSFLPVGFLSSLDSLLSSGFLVFIDSNLDYSSQLHFNSTAFLLVRSIQFFH